jgi:hypothetical protein
VRHRAKQWGAEVADIHIARKAIQWLSTSATALAEKLLDAYSGEVPDIRSRLVDSSQLAAGAAFSSDVSGFADLSSTIGLIDLGRKSSGEAGLEQHSVPQVIQVQKKSAADRFGKKDVDSDDDLSGRHVEDEDDENDVPFADDDQDSDYEAELSSRKRKANKKSTAPKGEGKASIALSGVVEPQRGGSRKRKATIDSTRLTEEGTEAAQSLKSNAVAPRSKRVRASVKEDVTHSENTITARVDVGQIQEPSLPPHESHIISDAHDDFVPAHEVFVSSTSVETHGLKPALHHALPPSSTVPARAPAPSVNVIKPVPPPQRTSIMAATGRSSIGGTSSVSAGGRISLGRTTVFSTTATMAAASVSAAPAQAKRAALGSLSQNTHAGAGTAKAKAAVPAAPPSAPAPSLY